MPYKTATGNTGEAENAARDAEKKCDNDEGDFRCQSNVEVQPQESCTGYQKQDYGIDLKITFSLNTNNILNLSLTPKMMLKMVMENLRQAMIACLESMMWS